MRAMVFYMPDGRIVGSTTVPDLPEYFERQTHPQTSLKLEVLPSLLDTVELYEIDVSSDPHKIRRKP